MMVLGGKAAPETSASPTDIKQKHNFCSEAKKTAFYVFLHIRVRQIKNIVWARHVYSFAQMSTSPFSTIQGRF